MMLSGPSRNTREPARRKIIFECLQFHLMVGNWCSGSGGSLWEGIKVDLAYLVLDGDLEG